MARTLYFQLFNAKGTVSRELGWVVKKKLVNSNSNILAFTMRTSLSVRQISLNVMTTCNKTHMQKAQLWWFMGLSNIDHICVFYTQTHPVWKDKWDGIKTGIWHASLNFQSNVVFMEVVKVFTKLLPWRWITLFLLVVGVEYLLLLTLTCNPDSNRSDFTQIWMGLISI